MRLFRQLGMLFCSLLLLAGIALLVTPQEVSAQTTTNISTYTYELVDPNSNPSACNTRTSDEVLSIVETTSTTSSGSGFANYYCYVPQSSYEFVRTGNTNNKITVVATTPNQGSLQTPNSTQPSAVNIGATSVFNQYVSANPVAEENQSCESAGGAMGWLSCPLVNTLSSALSWLDTRIQGLLAVGEDRYTNPQLKEAWMNFRNIAYLILIPIMLVMVIGTALGFEMFSAYTVKKALPRMVIAIVFITLSWYITTFLIGLFNVIGAGILGLMTSPFGIADNMSLNTLFSVSSDNAGDIASTAGGATTQAAVTLGALGALGFLLTTGGLPILLLYLMPVVLFILGAFLVLMLRELFILGAVLLAPVAIISWVFPNNDKLWKLWWNMFSKLLMMFPLIMIIIGAGRIAAHMIDISGGGGAQSVINPLLKLTAYILPYMFIPFAFKFAGGVFANLAGIVNDREKGLLDRARKSRGERWGEWNGRRKNGNMWRNVSKDSRRGKLNDKIEHLSNMGASGFTLNKSKRHGRMESHLATNNLAAAHQAIKEDHALSVLMGNEDYGEAGRSGHGYVKDDNGNYILDASGSKIRRDGSEKAIRAHLTGGYIRGANGMLVKTDGGLTSGRGYSEEDVQSVWHARRGMSQDVFNIASVLSIPGTGTGFGSGAGQMDAAINETVGNNRRLAATMLAEMRSTAERAGRGDLKGGGFGGRLNALQKQYSEEVNLRKEFTSGAINESEFETRLQIVRDQTTNHVVDMTVYSTESRGIAGMKPKQIRDKVLPNIQAHLEEAYREGNQDKIAEQLAKAAMVYDQAQYTSFEVQDTIAKGLMSLQISNRTVKDENGVMRRATVREDVENARNNKVFLEHRREIGSGRTAAEVARMTDAERQEELRRQQEQQDRDQG